MNKEKLLERIGELPLYEKREIQIADKTGTFSKDAKHKAICEVNGNTPYAFVGDRYTVVQMKDVFEPIVNGIKGEVHGILTRFGGFASLSVFPEDDNLKEGRSKFGLIAMNSVDCSSAIVVKFCVDYGGRRVIIPRNVAGIKKAHTKRAITLVQDYLKFIGPAKSLWGNIVKEFPKHKIVRTEAQGDKLDDPYILLGDIIERLNLGTRMGKKISEKYDKRSGLGLEYTLWDVFTDALDMVSAKNYKSDKHKDQKIDKLCASVFKHAMVMGL